MLEENISLLPVDPALDVTEAPVSPSEEVYVLPTSFAQQRLWLLDRLEPNNPAYNIHLTYRVLGHLNVSVLEQSLNEIVRRHEALRTTFEMIEGQPAQLITPSLTLPLPLIDLSQLSPEERQVESQRLALGEARQPFDLARGPLVRLKLIRLAAEEHLFLLTMHHIISDGWSMGIFREELLSLYQAYLAGQPSPLPELPIQYADFAVWQREWLQGEVLEEQLAYWRQHLAGRLPVLELPADHPRPAIQTFRGAKASFRFSASLTESLKALSRQEGATLFMTLLAAYQTLLYRYTGQEDIIVGSPIANRNRTELEGLIGFFLNTLVLRTNLGGKPTFRELLSRVREVALDAYAHQDLPVEKLIEALQPERNQSHTPLFQVLFVLQNTPDSTLKLPGLILERLKVDNQTAKLDLSVYIWEDHGELTGYFEYNLDLFNPPTIERMVSHFETLLAGAVANPDQPIATLPLLTGAEQRQILIEWNNTATPYDFSESLARRLEAQVERTPEAIAFVTPPQSPHHEGRPHEAAPTGSLTYRELNRQVNRLAHYLRGLGVGPGIMVGLCLERSLAAVVGMLAILKAGGVYIPLDPAYPQERLRFIVQDAQMGLLLTHSDLAYLFSGEAVRQVCLDLEAEAIAGQSEANPPCLVTPETLAYAIYTSGSTGKPKGVAVPHRQILNRLNWMWQAYPFGPDEMSCQKTALNFVDSLWELLGPLLQGSPTVIIPDPVLRDPAQLVDTLAHYGVTRLWLVPSLLRLLLDHFPDLQTRLPKLRFWVSSGEALSVELFERFCQAMPQSVLYNLYGASEVWDVTWYTPDSGASTLSRLPIGRPIANMETYILDAHLQPVPVGVPGELYVGGVGLAQGYINRPELTAEKFIPHPFKPQARLYRSGDLARYLPDGNIEYIGRSDHQVKLRGFRIELDEIESLLHQHEAIRQAVLILREEPPGEKRLVAYLAPQPGAAPAAAELRLFLKQRLPDYMIPATFVFLADLPLTPSGKVNRLALPAPESGQSASAHTFVAARDTLELQLTKIWEKLLDIRPVGITDNFFDLGGHSFLAIQLFTQLEKITGKKLSLALLFQAPTIEGLAALIRQEGESLTPSSLVAMQPMGSNPPFFCLPGNLGNVFTDLGHLVRHLEPDQPFYALQDGLHTPIYIEAQATYYIKEIRRVQPQGPYRLGGICLGGLVAYEMARQLVSQGETVAFLALIEPPRPHTPTLRTYTRFAADTLRHVLRRARHQTRQLAQVEAAEQGTYLRLKAKVIANRWAVARYAPQPYPGYLHLFLSVASLAQVDNPQLKWLGLAAGGAELHELPGTHNTITGNNDTKIEETHMQALAESLNACLKRI